MTKEKAREIIEAHGIGFTVEQFDEAISVAFDSKEPQGLDEAAEISANGAVISRQSHMDGRVVYNLNERCFDHSDLMKQFKAGAKWMAEQGVSVERTVDNFGDGDSVKTNYRNGTGFFGTK